MSAGVMPRTSKTEPWELIQAFAEAMDRATMQGKDLQNRREITAMKEAGDDRRMERGSQLAIQRLAEELKLKEPYETSKAEREHGYDISKMEKGGEIARQNYGAQGDVQQRVHQSNKRFDVDTDIRVAPQRQQIEDTAAERAGQRKRAETDYERQQRFEDDKRRLDITRQQQLEDEGRKEKQQERLLTRQTDEQVRKERELQPLHLERDRTRGQIVTERREAEIEKKQGFAEWLQGQKDKARLLSDQMKDARSERGIRLRAELAKRGTVEAAPGQFMHDPTDFVEEGALDFKNPAKFKRLGVAPHPNKPGKNVEIYQDLSEQYFNPFQQTRPPVPERPPETTQPAPPAQGGGPDTDWLRPPSGKGAKQSSLEGDDYATPLEQLRKMVTTADPEARLQYASFREAAPVIGEVRPELQTPVTQGNVTTVQKGEQQELRGPPVADPGTPVTTSGRDPNKGLLDKPQEGPLPEPRNIHPDNMGTWRITAAEAPEHLRSIFERVAEKRGISADLLAAQSHQESIGWKPSVLSGKQRSPAGAIGISQFMPGTAAQYGVNPRDIASSVDGQARYMNKLLDQFNGNVGMALAGYNWGESRVQKRLQSGQTNFGPTETRKYVQAITGRPLEWWAQRYQSGGGTKSASSAPLPPSRPADIGGTTTVAKDDTSGFIPDDDDTPTTAASLPSRQPDAPMQDLPLDTGRSREGTTGFVFHHTGATDPLGRPMRTVQDVRKVLQNRGMGAQYIMDRDGTIHQMTADDASVTHIRPGQGIGKGLSNKNTIGMEILAADDKDITPAQLESARRFYSKMSSMYPNMRAYSHGEINPHKQHTEGSTVVNALRDDWRRSQQRPRIERTKNKDLFFVDI